MHFVTISRIEQGHLSPTVQPSRSSQTDSESPSEISSRVERPKARRSKR